MTERYLTKSRFKLAIDCPTKLYYVGKQEYANNSVDNPFLEALAEGGFQVGELAKYYYPGGIQFILLITKKLFNKPIYCLSKMM